VNSGALGVEADEDDGWFHAQHVLDRSLPEGFPAPRLRIRDRGYFRVGPDGWTGYWPAEDHAVAPDLDWTEAHRILVLAAYNAERGRFLEENQTYEIVWPPQAYLKTAGYVVLGEPLGCLEHGDPDCDECEEFEAAPPEIKPAEWSWSVGIDLHEWDGDSGSRRDRVLRIPYDSDGSPRCRL
jgi:hypothetical protein